MYEKTRRCPELISGSSQTEGFQILLDLKGKIV